MNGIADTDTYPVHLAIHLRVELVAGGPFIHKAEEFPINPE